MVLESERTGYIVAVDPVQFDVDGWLQESPNSR